MKNSRDAMDRLKNASNIDYETVDYRAAGDKVRVTSQNIEEAKRLWEERPCLLPEEDQKAILLKLKESDEIASRDVKPALSLLSARSAMMLKLKYKLDITPIFKRRQYNIANSIKNIITAVARESQRTDPAVSIWLLNFTEAQNLSEDWQSTDEGSILNLFLLARALIVSEHPTLTYEFSERMKALFPNGSLDTYASIEYKKGNAVYKPKEWLIDGGFMIEAEASRQVDLFRLSNSVLCTLTNLIFPLDHYQKEVSKLVWIIKGNGTKESTRLVTEYNRANQILHEEWDAKKVEEKIHRENLGIKFQQLDYSILTRSQILSLTKLAFTWQLPFQTWSQALQRLAPEQLSAADNLEIGHIYFALSIKYQAFLYVLFSAAQAGPRDRDLAALPQLMVFDEISDQKLLLDNPSYQRSVEVIRGLRYSGLFNDRFLNKESPCPIRVVLQYVLESKQNEDTEFLL